MTESPYAPPQANLVGLPNGSEEIINFEHQGVRGWLLFFCVSLTILMPLTTLSSLGTAYAEWSKYFAQFPRLRVTTLTDIVLGVGMMGYSVYAGIALWRVRPGSVMEARRFLLTLGAYRMLSGILPFLAGLPTAANDAMRPLVLVDVFRAAVYIGIWYSYLNKSKRVKNTYIS